MKAISLWQPWASLWLTDRKIHETRHWRTPYRGWLLVHAAKKIEHDVGDELAEICCDEFGGHWGMDLPRGALIGRVELIDMVSTDTGGFRFFEMGDDFACGDFSPGRYGWKRERFEAFKTPIPYRGAQSLFDVPEEVLANVSAPPPANLLQPELAL